MIGYNGVVISKYLSHGTGLKRVFLLGLAVVLLTASCSRDAEETPPESTVEVTAPAVTTGPTSTPTTEAAAAPDTTAAVTTTTFPTREVLAYYDELSAAYAAISDLVADMRSANNDWDNRSVTGVSYGATEEKMSGLLSRAQDLRDTVGFIDPPADRGLPVEHRTAWMAAGQMADAARDALTGLRSSDDGSRRRAALAEFIEAFGRFEGAVGRVVEIIGLGSGITTTTTTTAAATTTTTEASTTTTTAAATTTTTEAEATTTTTEAEATTTTTEAEATTTTTEAAATTTTAPPSTVPPPAGVGYRVLSEEDQSTAGAKRIWLTVSVDSGATKEQLARLGNRLAAEYRLSRDYQALLLHFVHYAEEPNPTLGTWTDAPYGVWDRASEAGVGDYSNHQSVDRTVEKDWSTLPTRDQVELYQAYTRYRAGLIDPEGGVPPDEEVIGLAAQYLDSTEGRISEAIRVWKAWTGE